MKLSDKIKRAIAMEWPPDAATRDEWLADALELESQPPAAIAGVVDEMEDWKTGWDECSGVVEIDTVNDWIARLRAALEQGEQCTCGKPNCFLCHPSPPIAETRERLVAALDKPAPEPEDSPCVQCADWSDCDSCKHGPVRATEATEPEGGELLPCPLPECTGAARRCAGAITCSNSACELRHVYMPRKVWQSLPRRSAEVAEVANEMAKVGIHSEYVEKVRRLQPEPAKVWLVIRAGIDPDDVAVHASPIDPPGGAQTHEKPVIGAVQPEPVKAPAGTERPTKIEDRTCQDCSTCQGYGQNGRCPECGKFETYESLDETRRALVGELSKAKYIIRARDTGPGEPAKAPAMVWAVLPSGMPQWWPKVKIYAHEVVTTRDQEAMGMVVLKIPIHGVAEGECEGCEKLRKANHELSGKYLNIRGIVGAWKTKPGGSDRFELTERLVREAVEGRDTARADLKRALEDAAEQNKRRQDLAMKLLETKTKLDAERRAHEETRKRVAELEKRRVDLANAAANGARDAVLRSGGVLPPYPWGGKAGQ